MSRLNREWAVKLSMLRAITRSQLALARILESVADISAAGTPTPAVLHEHVRVLTDLQAALLGSVTGISWKPPKQGKPSAPWLAGKGAIRATTRRIAKE